METKKFPFKIEELVVIAAAILASARRDLADLAAFSSLFTVEFLNAIGVKIEGCKNLIFSSTLAKELRQITDNVYEKSKDLRRKLNMVETYFEYADDATTVAVADSGVKSVRINISRGNTEGVVADSRVLLSNIKRNRAALEAKGMTAAFVTEFEADINEIEALNNQQIDLEKGAERQTAENMGVYNDLWSDIQQVISAAKAIYKGVDEVKLKEYTVSLLRKRINAEGSEKSKTAEPTADSDENKTT